MRRHPDWLKVKIGGGENFVRIKSLLRTAKLHTICEEAKCPNIAECFNNGTAVFLILGDTCSRNCRYCNVKNGKPSALNLNEPKDVAESVRELGLKYVVITSVTRDDLEDGGAIVFNETVKEIKRLAEISNVEAELQDLDLYKLLKAFEKAMDIYISETDQNAHTILQFPYTIEGQKEFILTELRKKNKLSFIEIIESNPLKIAVIYNFLAILEILQSRLASISVGKGYNNFWLKSNIEKVTA